MSVALSPAERAERYCALGHDGYHAAERLAAIAAARAAQRAGFQDRVSRQLVDVLLRCGRDAALDLYRHSLEARGGHLWVLRLACLLTTNKPVPLGLLRVADDGAGGWDAAEGETGEAALIVPMLRHGPLCAVELFAVRRAGPALRRTGLSDVLGEDALFDAAHERGGLVPQDGSLRLHATPQGWLRGGRKGACVVEWTDAVRRSLRACTRVVCDDAAAAEALHRQLTRPRRKLPEIFITSGEAQAAKQDGAAPGKGAA